MKAVKTATLTLKRGRERVYVAELVALDRDGPDRYLVNYRYGWVGGELTEGTRTPDPVDMSTAENLLKSLVIAREAQGYTRTDRQVPWDGETPAGPSSVVDGATDPKSARLLYLLERIDAMSDASASKLIWRIGQVRLPEALPQLLDLRHHADEVTLRGLAFALCRCGGDRPDEVWPALRLMAKHDDPVVAEQAKMACILIDDPEADVAGLIDELPRDIAEALVDEPEVAVQRLLGFLTSAAEEARMRRMPKDFDYGAAQQNALVNLYLIGHRSPEVRQILIALLRVAPFAPFVFRGIRRLFKAAEAFDDAAVFAVLARRFDDAGAFYNRGWLCCANRLIDRSPLTPDGFMLWPRFSECRVQ